MYKYAREFFRVHESPGIWFLFRVWILLSKSRLLISGAKCKERVAELSATLDEEAKKEEEAKEARKRPPPPPPKTRVTVEASGANQVWGYILLVVS